MMREQHRALESPERGRVRGQRVSQARGTVRTQTRQRLVVLTRSLGLFQECKKLLEAEMSLQRTPLAADGQGTPGKGGEGRRRRRLATVWVGSGGAEQSRTGAFQRRAQWVCGS